MIRHQAIKAGRLTVSQNAATVSAGSTTEAAIPMGAPRWTAASSLARASGSSELRLASPNLAKKRRSEAFNGVWGRKLE